LVYIEFLITNVCNLTCSNCRSFNDFDFKNHYDFNFELYKQWAKIIDLHSYTILGGEPLIHPNFEKWIVGTRELWPNAWAKVDTNGTYINKVKNLHGMLVDNQYFLCINIHDPSEMNTMLTRINDTFGHCDKVDKTDPRIRYNRFFQEKCEHDLHGDWLITSRGLPINIRPAWIFQKTIGGTTDWKKLMTNNNDKSSIFIGNAKESHDKCCSSKCHVMGDGELFKCAAMATLPTFLSQKNIKWPDDLLFEYKPISIDNFSFDEFNKLPNEIPQCKFCDTNSELNISVIKITKKENKKLFK
jgi:hypothetical protein